MTRVAITGAAGNVGREALVALDEHDVTPLTHQDHDDIDGTAVEIKDPDDIRKAVAGHDILVHLAANPSTTASWESVRRTNIDGTHNTYEAARLGGVRRVVFASTNHVTNMYNVAERDEPGTAAEDAHAIHNSDAVRPDSYYGVSKVTGEALSSYYADRYGMEFVNLRIGWLLTSAELREKQDTRPARARHARAMWLSPRDCRDVIACAVNADLPENPLTVNAVSRNSERHLSITDTMRSLGYQPRDDSREVLQETK